jgi:hypothetical protein
MSYSGIGYAPEYQVSGLPYLSSGALTTTPTRIDFPFVTRDLVFVNSGSDSMRVGFTAAGISGSNWIKVLANTTLRLELRVKSVFIQADATTTAYSMCAGLTTVPQSQMPTITGSMGSGSMGWTGVG